MKLCVGFLQKCIDDGTLGYYLPMLQYLTCPVGSNLTKVSYIKIYVNLCVVG